MQNEKGALMKHFTLGKWTLGFAILLMTAMPAFAQGRGGRGASGGRGGVQIGVGGQQNQQAIQQAIQQITQQLQEGERALQEASEKAEEMRREWQKVDTEHKQNLRELAQARKFAEEEAKNLPELKAAKEKLEGLRAQLGEVRKKVIETLLAENEEYQKAVKVHADAVADQKANTGPSVSPEARREFAKKVSDADKAKKTIEDVAMANNEEAKELAQQIKEATAELGAASKKKNEAIDSDPKLSSAKVAFQRTRDELKKAKADLDQADGEARRIRSAMLSLANQRASLQNQLQNQQRMQQGANGYPSGNQGGRPR